MAFIAKFRFTILLAIVFLANASMASNMDAFEENQVDYPVVHGLDHLFPLAARVLTRDPFDTGIKTVTVTVTESECSAFCFAATASCEPVPATPALPSVTTSTITLSPIFTINAPGNAPGNTPSVVPGVPPVIIPSTMPPVVSSVSGSGPIPVSGTGLAPNPTSTTELPTPTQGLSTTLATSLGSKTPVTPKASSGATSGTPVASSTLSTHSVIVTKTTRPSHPAKSTAGEVPTASGTSTPAASTHPNVAGRLHGFVGRAFVLTMTLVSLFQAL